MNELTVKMCRNRRHLVLSYGAIPFSFRKPLILHLIEKSGLRLPRGQQLSISTPLLRIHSNFQFLVHPLLHPLLNALQVQAAFANLIRIGPASAVGLVHLNGVLSCSMILM